MFFSEIYYKSYYKINTMSNDYAANLAEQQLEGNRYDPLIIRNQLQDQGYKFLKSHKFYDNEYFNFFTPMENQIPHPCNKVQYKFLEGHDSITIFNNEGSLSEVDNMIDDPEEQIESYLSLTCCLHLEQRVDYAKWVGQQVG